MPKKGYKQTEAQKAAIKAKGKAYRERIKAEKEKLKLDKPGDKEGINSNRKILTEIKLKGEADKMTEIINPKKEKKSGSEAAFQCGECKGTFNHKAEGNRCPLCGIEF